MFFSFLYVTRIFEFDNSNYIYNSLYGRKKQENWEVICRSAADILHKAYERVGIKSKLINTINDEGSLRYLIYKIKKYPIKLVNILATYDKLLITSDLKINKYFFIFYSLFYKCY